MSELESLQPPEPPGEKDWPAKTSDMVVQYVGTVRQKTTGPALVASRYAVHLLAIALIGVVLFILTLILILRILVLGTGALPFVDNGEPWLAYLILGSILTLAGMFLWKKRTAKEPDEPPQD